MFLPCYPLFLVECKSNHPFFGHHNHRALSVLEKEEEHSLGCRMKGSISTQHHMVPCQVIPLLARVNDIPQEMRGHLRSDLSWQGRTRG